MKPFTVGVTGHRDLAKPEKCSRTIADILGYVRNKAHQKGNGCMAVLSPLAEGADRLVVRECLKFPEFILECSLPLEINEFLNDFTTEESQKEFFCPCCRKATISRSWRNRQAAMLPINWSDIMSSTIAICCSQSGTVSLQKMRPVLRQLSNMPDL